MSKTALEIAKEKIEKYNSIRGCAERYTTPPIPISIILAEEVVKLTEENESLKVTREEMQIVVDKVFTQVAEREIVKSQSQALKEAEEIISECCNSMMRRECEEWLAKYCQKVTVTPKK